MKKLVLMASVALIVASCKKNENEVKTEDTVIEGKADTIMVDTDTVSNEAAELPEQPEKPEAPEQKEQPERAEPAEKKVSVTTAPKADYASFGDKILADNALSKEQMLAKYKKLKQGDTINVKFKTKVADVCKKKGCWMALELPNQESAFVRFKDYGFFVPLNSTGEEAVVSGKAFVTETSVAELKHYAKDGGKSAEEIAKITEPKFEYGFLANGVLISR